MLDIRKERSQVEMQHYKNVMTHGRSVGVGNVASKLCCQNEIFVRYENRHKAAVTKVLQFLQKCRRQCTINRMSKH